MHGFKNCVNRRHSLCIHFFHGEINPIVSGSVGRYKEKLHTSKKCYPSQIRVNMSQTMGNITGHVSCRGEKMSDEELLRPVSLSHSALSSIALLADTQLLFITSSSSNL